jgi:hypothetical protein
MLPIYLELAFQLFRMCPAYVAGLRRLMQSKHRELLYLRPGIISSAQAEVAPALVEQEHQLEEGPSGCWCDQGLDVAGTDRAASIKAIRSAVEHLIAAFRRCCQRPPNARRRDLNSSRLP